MTKVVLLGPQRKAPHVRQVLDEMDCDGPVALVTAGWEERESEDDELTDHLGRETRNLALYARREAALEEDPELMEALHERDDTLAEQQALYRLRLHHAMQTVHELIARRDPNAGEGTRLESEIEDALGSVHVLDMHHRERVRDLRASFEEQWQPLDRPALTEAREAVAADLADCDALAIAGGHVGTLLGRIELFARELFSSPSRALVAWSAGAMALTDQVVLFHDLPPQGRGDAEVLRAGLGLCPDLIALPHARHRLLLDDALRVEVLARRFAPASCIAMDAGCRADWDGHQWTLGPGCRRLGADGRVQEPSPS